MFLHAYNRCLNLPLFPVQHLSWRPTMYIHARIFMLEASFSTVGICSKLFFQFCRPHYCSGYWWNIPNTHRKRQAVESFQGSDAQTTLFIINSLRTLSKNTNNLPLGILKLFTCKLHRFSCSYLLIFPTKKLLSITISIAHVLQNSLLFARCWAVPLKKCSSKYNAKSI